MSFIEPSSFSPSVVQAISEHLRASDVISINSHPHLYPEAGTPEEENWLLAGSPNPDNANDYTWASFPDAPDPLLDQDTNELEEADEVWIVESLQNGNDA